MTIKKRRTNTLFIQPVSRITGSMLKGEHYNHKKLCEKAQLTMRTKKVKITLPKTPWD